MYKLEMTTNYTKQRSSKIRKHDYDLRVGEPKLIALSNIKQNKVQYEFQTKILQTMLGITTQFKARAFALALNHLYFSYGLERHCNGMVLDQVWIRFRSYRSAITICKGEKRDMCA